LHNRTQHSWLVPAAVRDDPSNGCVFTALRRSGISRILAQTERHTHEGSDTQIPHFIETTNRDKDNLQDAKIAEINKTEIFLYFSTVFSSV